MRNNQLMAFESWIEDGNAMIMDNAWTTQDAGYTNRIATKGELFKYYLKEFFGINPAQYLFTEVLKYMEVKSETEYELKYNYASDWIVDLFMTLRASEFGQFANYEGLKFKVHGATFRLDKELGRFGRYGKLYITLDDWDCVGDFLS